MGEKGREVGCCEGGWGDGDFACWEGVRGGRGVVYWLGGGGGGGLVVLAEVGKRMG